MLLYLDASALVKRYVDEHGSSDVMRITAEAAAVATTIVSRAETAAALAKAVRVGALRQEDAVTAAQFFRSEWDNFVRIQVTEAVVARADQFAWAFGLRGYDAVQLASALLWHEHMNETIVFATYDRHLWQTAASVALTPFPGETP